MLNFGLDFRIEKEIGKGGSGSLSICCLLNEETKDMFKTDFAVVKILNRIYFHLLSLYYIFIFYFSKLTNFFSLFSSKSFRKK